MPSSTMHVVGLAAVLLLTTTTTMTTVVQAQMSSSSMSPSMFSGGGGGDGDDMGAAAGEDDDMMMGDFLPFYQIEFSNMSNALMAGLDQCAPELASMLHGDGMMEERTRNLLSSRKLDDTAAGGMDFLDNVNDYFTKVATQGVCTPEQQASMKSAMDEFKTCSGGVDLFTFIEYMPSAMMGASFKCGLAIAANADLFSADVLESESIPEECADVFFGANPMGDVMRSMMINPDVVLPCLETMGQSIPSCRWDAWPMTIVGDWLKAEGCFAGTVKELLQLVCWAELQGLEQCLAGQEEDMCAARDPCRLQSLYMNAMPPLLGAPMPDTCVRVAAEKEMTAVIDAYNKFAADCTTPWAGWTAAYGQGSNFVPVPNIVKPTDLEMQAPVGGSPKWLESGGVTWPTYHDVAFDLLPAMLELASTCVPEFDQIMNGLMNMTDDMGDGSTAIQGGGAVATLQQAATDAVTDPFSEINSYFKGIAESTCSDADRTAMETAMSDFETCTGGLEMNTVIQFFLSALTGGALECALTIAEHGDLLSMDVISKGIPPKCLDAIIGANPMGDMVRELFIHPDVVMPCMKTMADDIPLCMYDIFPMPLVGEWLKSASCFLGNAMPMMELVCKAELNAIITCLNETASTGGDMCAAAQDCTVGSFMLLAPPPIAGMPMPDACARMAETSNLTDGATFYDSWVNSCTKPWPGWELEAGAGKAPEGADVQSGGGGGGGGDDSSGAAELGRTTLVSSLMAAMSLLIASIF